MIADTLPDWLNESAWAAFKKMRAKKGSRAPFTDDAERRILLKLDALRLLGNDPTEVLWQSVECGWSGVFQLKTKPILTPVASPEAETVSYRQSKAWIEDMAAHKQQALNTDKAAIRARLAEARAKVTGAA
jgi:hypothetical protein